MQYNMTFRDRSLAVRSELISKIHFSPMLLLFYLTKTRGPSTLEDEEEWFWIVMGAIAPEKIRGLNSQTLVLK